MLFFSAFIFELFFLFFLSRKLINSLAQLIYRFTRSHKAVVNILAIIFLPGTILHELAHLLFAGVMLVPVGEMNVLPEIEGEGVKLGSVQIGHSDPLRRMIIGLAPVLFGLLLILTALYFIRSGTQLIWWQILLILYLVFEIGNTMFSSKKDIEGTLGFLAIIVVLVIVLIVVYFVNPALVQQFWAWLNSLNMEVVTIFFKMAAIYLLVPVALDIAVIFLASRLRGF